jgi:hypothetical protein
MLHPGRYETMLGHLGVALAAHDAQRIQIVDEGGALRVSWQTRGGGRQQRSFFASELQERPPWFQGRKSRLGHAALLGQLGRQLDRTGVDVLHIEEQADGFQVRGATSGRYASRHYADWELGGGEALVSHSGVADNLSAATPASPRPRTQSEPNRADPDATEVLRPDAG